MPISKDRVKELLGSGLGPSTVAAAVGCEVNYISQLMGDEQFAQEVVELRSKSLTAQTERDRSIDAIEDKLISKFAEIVENDMIYKPREILSAMALVNRMVRRGNPAGAGTIINNTVVQLVMPKVVHDKVTLNAQGEVVSVGEQTLVTMPAHQLLRELAVGGANDDRYKKVAEYLPGTAMQHGSAVGD